jgi:hypothetical protein
VDFLKQHQEARVRVPPPKFSEALELFERDLSGDMNMKPRSKQYRLGCILKLKRTWPELWDLHLDEITPQACKDWAGGIHKEIASQYFNNMIGTLRLVIAKGIKAHKEKTGIVLENPAMELRRVRVKPKDLKLPASAHFKALVENLRKKSGGWGPRVADLIEFLAYSGMRIKSEALWVKWDDIDWKQKEIIVRGNPVTATKNSEIRRVPIIQNLETLLIRIKDQLGTIKTERVLQVMPWPSLAQWSWTFPRTCCASVQIRSTAAVPPVHYARRSGEWPCCYDQAPPARTVRDNPPFWRVPPMRIGNCGG